MEPLKEMFYITERMNVFRFIINGLFLDVYKLNELMFEVETIFETCPKYIWK